MQFQSWEFSFIFFFRDSTYMHKGEKNNAEAFQKNGASFLQG